MTPLPIVFVDDARAEFDDAKDWYEDKKYGLGDEFVARVQDVFDLISILPNVHPVVYENTQHTVVTRFPYLVYYQVESDRIVIFSVFHSSRDPAIWQSRIP